MAEFTIDTAESHPIIAVNRTVEAKPEAIAAAMQEDFQTLGDFLAHSGVHPVGPPVAIYNTWDGTTNYDLGFPVSEADQKKAAGKVRALSTPQGKILRTDHVGPYERLGETYQRVGAEMKARGLRSDGPMWEVYVTDPGRVPDEELLTEVCFCVA